MGEKKLVDKTIIPQQVLYDLTPQAATRDRNAGSLGVVPIGYYREAAAFWDLDKAVNQPNVWAEQQHILGILDGREEDYDLQTLSIAAGEAVGTSHDAQLSVPDDEVWFINRVRMYVPKTLECSVDANWYCSLWKERISDLGYGQPFYGAARNDGVGGPFTYDAEFGGARTAFGTNSKEVQLRAPGGTIFTVVFTTRTAVGEAIDCTFQLFGYIGKSLVG